MTNINNEIVLRCTESHIDARTHHSFMVVEYTPVPLGDDKGTTWLEFKIGHNNAVLDRARAVRLYNWLHVRYGHGEV